MSNRKWLSFFPIGPFIAIASLVLAVWLFEHADRLDSTYQHEAKAKAYAYADRARVRIQRHCLSLPLPARYECAREEVETAREGQHNEYDLEAQNITANWTRHMGIAAVFGTAFGIIGVLLVLATFRQNKRAADAAASQVTIMRKSQWPDMTLGFAQYYVETEPGHATNVVGNPPHKGTFGLTFRNRGPGIGYPRRAFYGWGVFDQPPLVPEYPHEIEYKVGATVGPHGSCDGFRGIIELSEDEIASIAAGDARLWLWVKAVFADGEGGTHEVGQILRWSGDREFLPHPLGAEGNVWLESKAQQAYTYEKYSPPS